MISQAHRAYIYRIATAAVPLTVFYGLLAENAAALWLGLIGALLATGTNALAATNTPTKPALIPAQWQATGGSWSLRSCQPRQASDGDPRLVTGGGVGCEQMPGLTGDNVAAARATGDPIAVQRDTITSALEFLGIFDHDDITNVTINPKRITVIRRRRDDQGNYVAAGDEFVETVTTIAIRREGSNK